MINVKIDTNLKNICPFTRLGCIECNAKVKEIDEHLWKYIEDNIILNIKEKSEKNTVSEFRNISQSRKAYKLFGQDQSRYRISSEALIRRIVKQKEIYHVNTIVDVNNLISIESGFSVGSYDLSQTGKNILFRIGKENEKYEGIGKGEINISHIPVYEDEISPFGSTTSDSKRAMITMNTEHILMIICSFSDNKDLDDFIEKAEKYLVKFAQADIIRKWIVE